MTQRRGCRRRTALLAAILAFAQLPLAVAQGVAAAYPLRPLRLILPYPAGGAIDTLARRIAEEAGPRFGQSIVVDNRPGASGLIAMQACAHAAADGYNACIATGEHMSLNPALFPALPYDPGTDFVPVTRLVRIEGVIVANPRAGFATMDELIAAARAHPGRFNWASFGPGSNPHLYLEWIRRKAGVDIVHVPYKGSLQTIPAVLSGEAQVSFVALGFVLPQIRAGKLQALAVTGPARLAALPQVPTLAEAGLDPGLQSWVGLFVPAGTPALAVQRLNAAFAAAVRDPAFSASALAIQGYEPAADTPEQFGDWVREDRALARRVIDATGIRLEDASPPPGR